MTRRSIVAPPALALIAALASACPSHAVAQHHHESSPAPAEAPPPLLTGLGSVHHKVTTRVVKAQKYFDQGLRLAYAFHHEEAGRAFREAARLDPKCAMAWWGAALVLGPNINLPMSPEAERDAQALVQKALAAAGSATEAERAYMDALAKRYGSEPGVDRAARDSAYADAMRLMMKRYPGDPDAATLCAEALMDLRPWDLWGLDGTPQPGTPEIVSILESVLKRHPDHTGAIHLYIHAVEASPEPARAERHADRLARLAPAAGHLVHMPTHIHLRVGRYEDAQRLNAQAVAADRAHFRKSPPGVIYRLMYYPHNIHMRWSALCAQGRRADALAAARELEEAVPESLVREMPMAEFFLAARYLTLVRFGLWEEALKDPAPPSGMPLRAGVWRYARGMALAAQGKTSEAAAERDSLTAMAPSFGPDLYFGLNPAGPLYRFAATHLSGEIAARGGSTEDAIRLLREAASQQDSLRYDEPPPWQQTARQSLGAVLLAADRAAEAEAVYWEDLARYPENGWSLYGLTQALRAQKKTSEAAEVEKRFVQAWIRADMKLQASRY